MLLALSMMVLAAPAVAQNETNVTTTTIAQIVIPNITIKEIPGFTWNYKQLSDTSIEVILTCLHGVTECGTYRVAAGWNGTIYANVTGSFTSCTQNICVSKVTVSGITSHVTWLYIEYSDNYITYEENATIKLVQKPSYPIAQYFVSMIPFAVIAGMMARGNTKDAGVGGIAAAMIIWLLSAAGVVEYNATIVTLALIVGVMLLWL